MAAFLRGARGRMFCADCLSETLACTRDELRHDTNRLALTAGFSIGTAACSACGRVRLVVGFVKTAV